MFSLAMLVRLGRITESDVKATFKAFRRLDVGNYGKLNSRSIIEGEIMRRKSLRDLAALAPENQWDQPIQYTPRYTAELNSPNPYGPMPLARQGSVETYHSQGAMSNASSFDYDAYDRWAVNFQQYSSPP